MMQNKKLIAVAIASVIAIPAEGLRQWAYFDPPGILSVCYGSTTDVQRDKRYSLEECKTRLDADMLNAVTIVDRCVPGLPVEVLAAFSDAAYNIGPAIACDARNSTAARYLLAGQFVNACNQLPRWDKTHIGGVLVALPGLTTRREGERKLCLEGAT